MSLIDSLRNPVYLALGVGVAAAGGGGAWYLVAPDGSQQQVSVVPASASPVGSAETGQVANVIPDHFKIDIKVDMKDYAQKWNPGKPDHGTQILVEEKPYRGQAECFLSKTEGQSCKLANWTVYIRRFASDPTRAYISKSNDDSQTLVPKVTWDELQKGVSFASRSLGHDNHVFEWQYTLTAKPAS